jgi:hypothetical protein
VEGFVQAVDRDDEIVWFYAHVGLVMPL